MTHPRLTERASHRSTRVTGLGKKRQFCDNREAFGASAVPRSGVTRQNSTDEVGALLDRYLIDLDTAELDDAWAEGLFTPDARVDFPNAGHRGMTGLAAFHRESLAVFARTQHLHSPAVVTVDGVTAALRANLVSTHVLVDHDGAGEEIFAVGSLVAGDAIRDAAGWRLRALSFRLVWSTGRPPSAR